MWLINIVMCLVTIDEVWIGNWIYWTLVTHNYNLQFTITQDYSSQSSLALLGSGSQWQTFF
jgi:hypothetical protein